LGEILQCIYFSQNAESLRRLPQNILELVAKLLFESLKALGLNTPADRKSQAQFSHIVNER